MVELEILRDRVKAMLDGTNFDIEYWNNKSELYDKYPISEAFADGFMDCSEQYKKKLESLLDFINFMLKGGFDEKL
mgnify:CR=1 FL=1